MAVNWFRTAAGGSCTCLLLVLFIFSVDGQEQPDQDLIGPGDDQENGGQNENEERIQTRIEERTMGLIRHRFDVENNVEYYVKFKLPDHEHDEHEHDARSAVQVDFNSTEASAEFPIEVTIRQFQRIVSYQLPAIKRDADGKVIYSSSKRSMDFCAVKDLSKNVTITASISTSSKSKVAIDIKAFIKGKSGGWRKSNITSASGGDVYISTTAISPSQTRTRFFDTKLIKDAQSIILEVQAFPKKTSCLCSVVSIQQPKCNFQDTIGSQSSGMRLKGSWKTMLNQSAMIIDPMEYPHGFLLVMIASASDELCNIEEDEHRCSILNGNITNPKKWVVITVKSNGSTHEYIIATLAIIIPYIGVFILSITFSVLKFNYSSSKFENLQETLDENLKKLKENLGFEVAPREGFGLLDGMKQTQELFLLQNENENGKERLQTPALISGEQKDPNMDYIDDAESIIMENNKNTGEDNDDFTSYIARIDDLNQCQFEKKDFDITDSKTKRRFKACQFVTDMSTKIEDPTRSKSVYQKSLLYIGVLWLISIYYSLPVLQMVFRFSNEQRDSGNEDLCYYNDLCRKPLGTWSRDFNHLFSNFGYFVFGILFMCLVLLKKGKYETFLENNRNVEEDCYGVPEQFGLCFAMGLALAMEGIMSGSYHVCPTNVTFQFDTTFMYIMSVMMFIKLYQVRHSDVSANAVGVFFGLGVALVLETFSVYYSGPIFWFIFSLTYFIVMVIVAVHAYNVGAVRYNYKTVLCAVCKILYLEIRKLIKGRKESPENRPCVRSRLVGISVIFMINFVLLIFFAVSGSRGCSNALLGIFILNNAMYTIYYCIMKHKCGETINKVPITYTVLGLICFVPAMYFFTQKEKNSEVSPAESRSLNVDCLLLNFYDGHDIWHFLGGAGVFFAFMFYFTLDEDLKYKKRNTIHVF